MAGASGAHDKTKIEEESARSLRRRKDLELKIRKRVECEERAFRIVEKLIEGTFTSDYLIDCGAFITPSHYTDISEERAIIHLCGYPICPNSLEKVPKKKYHISTKSNKVFDITERKNFCSNQCFKASKYFEKQILTTPVWMRGSDPPRQLTVLDSSINIGSIGSEVLGGRPKIIPDLVVDEDLDVNDIKETTRTTTCSAKNSTSASVKKTDQKAVTWASDISCDRLIESFEGKVNIHENLVDNKTESEQILSEKDASDCSIPQNESESADKSLEKATSKKLESEASSTVSKTEYLLQLLSKRKNLLSKMVDDQPLQLQEEETNINKKMLSHLKEDAQNLKIIERPVSEEPQKVDKMGKYYIQEDQSTSRLKTVDSNAMSFVEDSTNGTNSNSQTNLNIPSNGSNQYPDMCGNLPSNTLAIFNRMSEWVTIATLHHLNVMQKSDEKGDNYGARNDSELQNENKETTESDFSHVSKVKPKTEVDFHTLHQQNKDFTIKVREFYKGSFMFKPAQPVTREDEEDDSVEPTAIPPVESVAQLSIRRKIVLQKLERSMSDVLVPLGLAIQHVGTEVKHLVATFNLTSKNVVMKPDQWKLTSLFLIKMLEKTIPVLQESFSQGTSLSVFENLLLKYSVTTKELEQSLQNIYKFKETVTPDKLNEN